MRLEPLQWLLIRLSQGEARLLHQVLVQVLALPLLPVQQMWTVHQNRTSCPQSCTGVQKCQTLGISVRVEGVLWTTEGEIFTVELPDLGNGERFRGAEDASAAVEHDQRPPKKQGASWLAAKLLQVRLHQHWNDPNNQVQRQANAPLVPRKIHRSLLRYQPPDLRRHERPQKLTIHSQEPQGGTGELGDGKDQGQSQRHAQQRQEEHQEGCWWWVGKSNNQHWSISQVQRHSLPKNDIKRQLPQTGRISLYQPDCTGVQQTHQRTEWTLQWLPP